MNRIDFSDVLRKMRASFERVDRWFSAAEKGKREDAIAAAWYELLKASKREDVMQAIDILFADDNRPKVAEDYPLRIRKLAREIEAKRPRPKGPDGEPTYSCPDCLGGPWISVFLDGTAWGRKAVEHYGPKARLMTVSVRCGKCRNNSLDVEIYNPETMVKYDVFEYSRRSKERAILNEIAPESKRDSMSREDWGRAIEKAGIVQSKSIPTTTQAVLTAEDDEERKAIQEEGENYVV